MAKRVIQVPVDDSLIEALNTASKKGGLTRSELIRQACRLYLRQLKTAELDTIYREGYENIPEEPAMGEIQADLAGQVLQEESW
ncbi:MAG: ribbon-helix-helix protein, CopG family [Actinobacteria bacterium]|nr:ribbon-helix-helix protein, CopG family [Actinomycetota bacterium]